VLVYNSLILPLERTCKTFANTSGKNHFADILRWAQHHFATVCYLNSNNCRSDKYAAIPQVYALGEAYSCTDDGKNAFNILKEFHDTHNDWIFGYLGYDLKNQIEDLSSRNHDGIMMPGMHFFVPEVVIFGGADSLTVCCRPDSKRFSEPDAAMHSLEQHPAAVLPVYQQVNMRPRVPGERYIRQVAAIREHIQRGDIYEMNYCIEFFDDSALVDPISLYANLNRLSPTPFSCFFSWDGKALMCASPERFIKKTGNKLLSQPIKGTTARGESEEEDSRRRQELLNNPKERSENVMIVDLVRNDLSRTAKDGSVKVEELFGIYPFSHVHQMISTVVSELADSFHPVDAIRHAFPMGSMTGAPKVRAMQLIEQYEDTKRGLYSGSVGYIAPNRDFDFNVVIRSILYNCQNNYLSYMAGSAITAGSVPEREYEECLLKAETMRKALEPLPD